MSNSAYQAVYNNAAAVAAAAATAAIPYGSGYGAGALPAAAIPGGSGGAAPATGGTGDRQQMPPPPGTLHYPSQDPSRLGALKKWEVYVIEKCADYESFCFLANYFLCINMK